jgi:hypothetical protein
LAGQNFLIKQDKNEINKIDHLDVGNNLPFIQLQLQGRRMRCAWTRRRGLCFPPFGQVKQNKFDSGLGRQVRLRFGGLAQGRWRQSLPLGGEGKWQYFLYLPDEEGNPGRDVDTLSFTYKFRRQNDCPGIWYESFSASYNDSLYHEGEFVVPMEFLK